jgi:SAM-dependent methyltransferase
MIIARPDTTRICPEIDIIHELLRLDGGQLLELGCGRAELTRMLATGGPGRSVLATEVDALQHAINLQINDLPNVTFALAGAQEIPAPAESADSVFLFKSLHHVPLDLLDQALSEVRRVLKPGGFAYVSEPVFAGEFNEILRLFHDEQQVRQAAFDAVCRAVESGSLQLAQQVFFLAPLRFADFAEFERKVLGVTHTQHSLSPEIHAEVRRRFERHLQPGGAVFHTPIRVDLLQKS